MGSCFTRTGRQDTAHIAESYVDLLLRVRPQSVASALARPKMNNPPYPNTL
jgi:hypothetical protein